MIQKHFSHTANVKWDRVFKNGQIKICGRQPLKNMKGFGLQQNFKNFKNYFKYNITGNLKLFSKS